jgi:hypothetical protein
LLHWLNSLIDMSSTTSASAREKIADAIIKSISSGLNISQACRANGVHRDTFANWRKADPELCERFEDAREHCRQKLLGKMLEVGKDDWRAYHESLRLSFPEYRYGNGPSVQVNTSVAVAQVSDEQRQRLIDLRNEALAENRTTGSIPLPSVERKVIAEGSEES